jgi:hypothetical protein
MKSTTDEKSIQTIFFEAQEKPFKCDTCEFSKLYRNTRDLFCAREERYRKIFETIAQMVNPNGGMCGKLYDELPSMLESRLDNSGDKAKLKAEVSRLTSENERLALEIIRLRGL